MSSPDGARTAAQSAVTEYLDAVSKGDANRLAALFADEAVFEFPFAPPGVPQSVRGTEAVLDHVTGFATSFDVRFLDFTFHDTVDPDQVIVEYRSEGTALRTGKPYNQTIIAVVDTDGHGRIKRYVDYWNPLIAIEAMTPSAN